MVSRHMDAHAKGFKHADGREGQSPDEGGSHTSSCSPATLGGVTCKLFTGAQPWVCLVPSPRGWNVLPGDGHAAALHRHERRDPCLALCRLSLGRVRRLSRPWFRRDRHGGRAGRLCRFRCRRRLLWTLAHLRAHRQQPADVGPRLHRTWPDPWRGRPAQPHAGGDGSGVPQSRLLDRAKHRRGGVDGLAARACLLVRGSNCPSAPTGGACRPASCATGRPLRPRGASAARAAIGTPPPTGALWQRRRRRGGC